MDIRPIRTEADYEAALAAIDRLMDAKPGSLEGDRLDVLTTLVQAYEAKHYPVDLPDPVAAIRFHMQHAGYRQSDLAKLLGSRSRASEVLARRRALTLPMIRALTRKWGIPAKSLVKPYALARSRSGSDRARHRHG